LQGVMRLLGLPGCSFHNAVLLLSGGGEEKSRYGI
jgi:hypothetical protein